MWTRALLLGAAGLLSGSVVGCAQERAPINQVQADALAKSFFVGADLKSTDDDPEFYMRGTIVDVGYGAAQDGLFTSTYAQPISRIRWEVTEDLLNARLSYERVQGSDGKGNQVDGLKKKATNDGQIVASYRIKSHFDIRRSYNPTTGEELNVVVENSSDRPWYQREYFRVDWSQNLATDSYDYDTLTSLGWIGGVEYAPLAYTVLDPSDPDAPHFDAESGYFDVTNKAFAKPAVIDISSLGWGLEKIPACMLPGDFAGGTQPVGDCNPIEITLRQSFRKVVDKDYEPVDYDGYRFQAFGIFTTERVGYNRDYGMIDADWHRFASRYNIWERSHYYKDASGKVLNGISDPMTNPIACATAATTIDPTADPNRDLDGDGTADECKDAGPGARCDIFNKKCTLPFMQRKTVVTPWYINGGSTATLTNLQAQLDAATDAATQATLKQQIADEQKKGEDLFEATNWGVIEWDLALKTAVQTARLVECRKTAQADCDTQFPMWTGQQDDNDEAIVIAREFNACRRQKAASVDATLKGDALKAARDAAWNDPSCTALVDNLVTTLKGERNGQTDGSADAIGAVTKLDPMIVLCHNPVQAGDHAKCGDVGLAPRLGDIRYNTVLNIDKAQQPSAWGIMVDADDPLTGEKVAASINIWTHITDVATNNLVDLVKYMNGELSVADITEGKYIYDWAKASQLGANGAMPTMSKDQIQHRLASAANMKPADFKAALDKKLPANVVQAAKAFHADKVRDLAVSNEVSSPTAYDTAAKMRAVRGTTTEATLINPAMLQAAGIKGDKVPSGAALDQASPLALNNPRFRAEWQRMRENAFAAKGACVLSEAPEASSLVGIADALKRKFPVGATESAADKIGRWEKMKSYVRRRYHYAVLGHEMGHSIGLRHNFVSTYAALHFRPQYWQLRTQDGKVTTQCTDAVADGSTCVGPRYYDPMTKAEESGMIWMFMHSTVMDYPGDVSQDTVGLGSYDFAAARMFYGDVTSVYNVQKNGALDPTWKSTGNLGKMSLDTTDNFGGLVGIQYSLGGSQGTPIHYSELQSNAKLIQNCYATTPAKPSWWSEDRDGAYDPLFDGHIIEKTGSYSTDLTKGSYTKCRNLPVDYMGWEQLRMPSASEGGQYYRGGNAVDPATKRVRVPYSFASDNWADLGNTSVFRHDNGADPYEQAMFFITTQEDRHIFDNYRRGRNTFNVRAAADRSYSRYNEKLWGVANGMAFLGNIYKDWGLAYGYSFNGFWPQLITELGYTHNVIGGTLAFDHFIRELSRPEAGEHYVGDNNVLVSAQDADGPAGTTKLVVPNGATGLLGANGGDVSFGGHPLENALAEDKGDYSTDYTINAGSYYDKINTAIWLALSEDRFISQSRGDFYDARFRSVGMADIYPEGFRRVVANTLTDDRSILAPHVTANNGNPQTNSNLTPKSPIAWTSWWSADGPRICQSLDNSNVCSSPYDDQTFGSTKVINPGDVAAVDPQIGWEVQKFMIAWTMAYIPANQKAGWVDMMRLYRLGENADPGIENRIEWQDPFSGQIYYAKTYGMECLFGPANATDRASCEVPDPNKPSLVLGKWVQKGIAARVLEYANSLTAKGFKLDASYKVNLTYGDGFNKYGRAMVVFQPDGQPVIVADPSLQLGTGPTCDQNVTPGCTPLNEFDNKAARHVRKYKSVPDYLWEVVVKYGIGTPDQLGVYPN
jgi:hypothetical protein